MHYFYCVGTTTVLCDQYPGMVVLYCTVLFVYLLPLLYHKNKALLVKGVSSHCGVQEAQEESTSRLDENSHMTAEIQEVTDKLSELEEALRLKTAEIETLRVEHDEELLRLRQGLEKEAGLKANVEEENKVILYF